METIGAGIVGQKDHEPQGVGGWLLIFVIWSALVGLGSIFFSISFFIGRSSELDSTSAGVGLIVGLLLLSDAILIVLRKKLARTLSLVACGFLSGIVLLELALMIGGLEKPYFASAMENARDLVLAVIWIFYFLSSRRVANTLVN